MQAFLGTSRNLPSELRYELKFVVDRRVEPDLDLWLLRHPLGLRKQHAARQVNNIYFDTFDSTLRWESVEGLESRIKYRLRWYGGGLPQSNCQFELKRKSGNLTSKEVTPVELAISRDEKISWYQLRLQISKHNNWFSQLPIALHPVMANSYIRNYFVSLDSTVRVTVDRSQRFYEVRRDNVFDNSKVTWEDPSVIVEAKAGLESVTSLRAFTERFPVRITRNSKFVNGVRAINS